MEVEIAAAKFFEKYLLVAGFFQSTQLVSYPRIYWRDDKNTENFYFSIVEREESVLFVQREKKRWIKCSG